MAQAGYFPSLSMVKLLVSADASVGRTLYLPPALSDVMRAT
jgi:hypothetical protein